MAKKDDLANDLSLGRNRKSLKKTIDNTTEEKAVEVVKKVVQSTEKEDNKLIRTTMDLPRYIHKAVKMKSAADEVSLKDYIVSLIKKDLNLD